ncbi:hypothetical protein FSP39_006926 [Pinctada imbricata]|uniref:Ig-like domain-containing protein n=1 Tax=Pinctada imbricata TaxID=66713 RepID=A0AA89BX04_PINIB|nr:hypothetical protein FSP39_006926 [Pinctada imbricata]
MVSCEWVRLAAVLVVTISFCFSTNIEVEYFAEAVVECDLNLTNTHHGSPVSKYWILPSGDVINNQSVSPIVKNMNQWTVSQDFENFNLTLHRVDDVDFGIYRCVVVFTDYHIHVASQGVNVNGAYFGELEEKYQKSAIIGGIAAGCLFVVVGGSCLIWQYRYSKRKNEEKDRKEIDNFDDLKNGQLNQGYEESAKL